MSNLINDVPAQLPDFDDVPPVADVERSNTRAAWFGEPLESCQKSAHDMNALEEKSARAVFVFLVECLGGYLIVGNSAELSDAYKTNGIMLDGHSKQNEFIPFLKLVNPAGSTKNRGKHAAVLLEALREEIHPAGLTTWIQNRGGIAKIAAAAGRAKRQAAGKVTSAEALTQEILQSRLQNAPKLDILEGVKLPTDCDFICLAIARDGRILGCRKMAAHEIDRFDPIQP